MSFQSFVHAYYQHFGRHDLPWRQNYDPYRIMVSEIMLQQTQVERVIPKFQQFLATFPTAQSLAEASVADVIRHWQGLGYNRRGLNLQRAAQDITVRFSGKVPHSTEELLSLPGIGPYTAAAIQAFAFNKPSTVIETNIRTVYIHHFFPGAYRVDDTQLLPLIAETMDQDQPRVWYSALMDYGTYLKSVIPNPTRRSKQYVKQSDFASSKRRVRGLIIKHLSQHGARLSELISLTGEKPERIQEILPDLIAEGFITQIGDMFELAS